ncbi:MAG: beta-xylosidase [Firmicutes bacterium]|nr:beta-xylosidase [Bacillota bacterium]
MAYATNPILRGFNPDPSILRVEHDYYIATSTFEWFPGVQIHHSTDLIHWELICHPLNRLSQLNMLGEQSSCGIWAPCLSYSDGIYYLIYTDVKSFIGMFKDTHNYLVTSSDIRGPWSEPVYLNSSGFDASLFHDENGKKYLLNMLMDYRCWNTKFGGIILQEYSQEKKALVGEPMNIFRGTQLRLTEGPHLYQQEGYYYLMTAEGGTGYEHAVTMARSKNIEGPYEVDPLNPMLTSLHTPNNPLQKAGHASLTKGHNGKWYLAHLCSRPVGDNRMCILGRETALEEVVWKDGWLRLANGGNSPCERVEIEGAEVDSSLDCNDLREDFDGDPWSIHLQTLRVPLSERASLTERPGYLRLYGRESFTSCHYQSLLAHRQQSFYVEATTKLDFQPKSFQTMAGLVYYYNSLSYYYLYITADEVAGRVLSIISCILGKGSQPVGVGIPLPSEGEVYLKLTTEKEKAYFSYSFDDKSYIRIGKELDATVLSDDYYNSTGHVMFTGAFIGICCQDLSGQGTYADFDYFEYKER